MPAARTPLARALALTLASIALLACGADDGPANANADAGLDTGPAGDAGANDDASDDAASTDASVDPSTDAAPERACPTFEPWPEGRHPGPCVVTFFDGTTRWEERYTWGEDGRLVEMQAFRLPELTAGDRFEYTWSEDGSTETIVRYQYGEVYSTLTAVTGPFGIESERLDFEGGGWAEWTWEYGDDGCLTLLRVANSASVVVQYNVEFDLVDGIWKRFDRMIGQSDLVNVTTLTPWGDQLEYAEYAAGSAYTFETNTFDAVGNQLTGEITSQEGTETSTYDYSCW